MRSPRRDQSNPRAEALEAATRLVLADAPAPPTDLASPWSAFVELVGSARLGRVDHAARTAIDALLAADDDLEARAYLTYVHGEALFRSGDLAGADATWQEAEAGAAGTALASRLRVRRALSVYLRGDLRAAVRLAQRGYAIAVGGEHRVDAGVAASYLANYAIRQGSLRSAERYVALAQAEYRDARDMGRGALVEVVAGWVEVLRGQWREGERILRDAERQAVELEMWFATALRSTRLQLLAPFLPDEVLDEVEGLLVAQEGNAKLTGVLLQARGAALLALERADEAMAAASEAVAVDPSPFDRITGLVLLGRARLLVGDRAGAEAPVREALELCEGFGCTYWTAAALVVLADICPAERRVLLAEARCFDDGDAAYTELFGAAGSLRISLRTPVGVWAGDEPVVFAGRQAEFTVLALAAAGEHGVLVEALVHQLWPSPTRERVPQRVRTLLWQVRRALDSDAWRLVRERDRLVLDCRNAVVEWPDDPEEVLLDWPHVSLGLRAWVCDQVLPSVS